MGAGMLSRALSYLACPRCRRSLVLEAQTSEGDQVITGQLRCSGCTEIYPITRGVPRFAGHAIDAAARSTVDRFGEQWNEFTFMSPEYEQQFLAWIAPNAAETFRDRVVLDGGCGKGRHSQLVARFGARDVLAVDLSSAVDAAFQNLRQLPNVHVIQADLFHLPIAPDVVDVAFSIGVVHHTPDPHGAFDKLVQALKPGGRVIVWVYGRENNEWIVRYVDPVRRALTSRLPHRWLYHLTKIPAVALYLASNGIYRPLRHPPFDVIGRRLFYQAYINALGLLPFRDIHLIVHDHLGPAIASYIPGDEFRQWFSQAPVHDVVVGWHNQNSWRGTAIRNGG
jgi:SAM-dependent methyltransferase